MDALITDVRAWAASDWIYVALFVIAVAEANVLTSFLLSGTLGFVVVGMLINRGLLDPVLAPIAIITGTVAGDVIGFLLAKQLTRFGFVASVMKKAGPLRDSLAAAPARFILVGHLTPYLKSVIPLLAAGSMPFGRYVAIDILGATLGTLFLVGIGYGIAQSAAAFDVSTSVTNVGLSATVILALTWVCSRRTATDRRAASWHRAFGRAARFVTFYPFWHPCRWIENWLRAKPTRQLRRNLEASFPDIRPGDILLIRLHAPAPWGRWAHTAVALEASSFCHGFGSTVTAHPLGALPVRYAIAHLRVRCAPTASAAAADVAATMLGTPVSVFACRHDQRRVSCASLAVRAYSQLGIELIDPEIKRVTPDDLFASDQLELVRIVHTERVRAATYRYVFQSREEG
jgi:membrane protein DedA with SNARE-associated domain